MDKRLEAAQIVKDFLERDAKMTTPFVFPQDVASQESATNMQRQGGLTLRDYFAAQALAVIPGDIAAAEELARDAYKIADAMLAAREK